MSTQSFFGRVGGFMARTTRPGQKWFSLDDDGDTAIVRIYDAIGMPGCTAEDFCAALEDIKSENISLRINSPGGFVTDGTAIFNALKRHPARVVTHIDGVAASMASVVALAGDEVHMAENAFFMIHNPWVMAIGDADDLRKSAGILDKMTGIISQAYADKTGMKMAEIQKLMTEETWFTGQEAKDAGFIDVLENSDDQEQEQARTRFDFSAYVNTPASLQGVQAATSPKTIRDLERVLRDAGYSRSQATAIASGGYKAVQRDSATALVDALKHNISLLERRK